MLKGCLITIVFLILLKVSLCWDCGCNCASSQQPTPRGIVRLSPVVSIVRVSGCFVGLPVLISRAINGASEILSDISLPSKVTERKLLSWSALVC